MPFYCLDSSLRVIVEEASRVSYACKIGDCAGNTVKCRGQTISNGDKAMALEGDKTTYGSMIVSAPGKICIVNSASKKVKA